MNGRVYDPWLGRFLSPDPFVQAPANSQNYNRYSYVLNNPLKYVDPSGYRYGPHFGANGRPVRDDMPGYGEGSEQMFGRQNDLSDGIAEMQAVFNNMGQSNQRLDAMYTNDKEEKKKREVVEQDQGKFVGIMYFVTTKEGAWILVGFGDAVGNIIVNSSEQEILGEIIVSDGVGSTGGGVSGDNIFAKTYLHFQIGGGDPLTIDASTLNFGNISKSDLKNLGNGRYGLNLYDKNPTSQAAIALGKITLTDQGNNQYSISPDYYDFNIEWQNGFSKRNIATFGAGILHYGVNPVMPSYPLVPLIFGGPYWIHFQGNVQIKP